MSVDEVLKEVAEQQTAPPTIPDDIPLSELAEQVVRGKVRLTPPQMRMLIELLPFYMPKLTAVAHSTMTGEDFASRLDRAVSRSDGVRFPRLIEAHAEPVSEANGEGSGALGRRSVVRR